MTKKRVKFGLAILGALSICLLALLALVFAPTGASAGKGPSFGQEQDESGHHPNLAYFEPPAGNGASNDPGHSDSGVGLCFGPLCDVHDDGALDDASWHYADGPGGQGGGNNQGNSPNPNSGDHAPGGNGYPPPLFVGGYPGGYPGGGYGAPQGQSSSCASKKDKDEDAKDKQSDDKACDGDNKDNTDNNSNDNSNNTDSGGNNDASYEQSLIVNGSNPPNNFVNDDQDDDDDDLPPVDPNCFPFTEGCDTHDPNPPNTDLTDPPTEVPEPLTLSLFAVGLTGAAALHRRSRQKRASRRD